MAETKRHGGAPAPGAGAPPAPGRSAPPAGAAGGGVKDAAAKVGKLAVEHAAGLPLWGWAVIVVAAIYLIASGTLSSYLSGLSAPSVPIGGTTADSGGGNSTLPGSASSGSSGGSSSSGTSGTSGTSGSSSSSSSSSSGTNASGMTALQASQALANLDATALTIGQTPGNQGILASLHQSAQAIRAQFPNAGPAGGYTAAQLTAMGYSGLTPAAPPAKQSGGGVPSSSATKKNPAPTKSTVVSRGAAATTKPVRAPTLVSPRAAASRLTGMQPASSSPITSKTVTRAPAARAPVARSAAKAAKPAARTVTKAPAVKAPPVKVARAPSAATAAQRRVGAAQQARIAARR